MLASKPCSTTDTVISVEEDPEIEALSKEPLTPPTGSTHLATPQRFDHTHIDLELGHDIPGLVTDPEVCMLILLCVGHPVPLQGRQ